ncbi:hypothetical protein DICVIV_08614 [Dictyocaulus viviparus]|uniref:Uncharacterized protein n=1 Tax=Dictyocaulus viviparus TaxID=29172 RepID=A0A0D8XL43_DICVI|nr:hypothetical protein DICVIV_08614 [Dictyocaulus viviparus]
MLTDLVMLASVSNPREVFRTDEFLVLLAQPTNVRFSLFEHAPPVERREKFQEAIAQRKLALTFVEMGVNLALDISTSTSSATKIDFESFPFLFNGVLCTARGHMDSYLLTGRVQFRFCEDSNISKDATECWSSDQVNNLRAMGLPL